MAFPPFEVSAVTEVCWPRDIKADPLFVVVKCSISRKRF